MATTFDGDNLIVTLNAGGAVHTVDWQTDVYSDWKVWVKTATNSRYAPAFAPDGGNPLTPGIDQGAYYFFRNDLGWRMKPAEEDSTITVTGNLVPSDATLPILIPTTGAFTVGIFGLQPITQNVSTLLTAQQQGAYLGIIHINTISGTPSSGTSAGDVVAGIGTATNPIDNIADATTLATFLRVTKFMIVGTVTLTQTYEQWEFSGVPGVSNIALGGQTVTGSHFVGLGLTGAMVTASPCVFTRCHIDPPGVSGFVGAMHDCPFFSTLTKGTGDINLFHCYSGIAGLNPVMLDANSTTGTITARRWEGGLQLQNFDQGEDASINLFGGNLILDATVSNAGSDIVIRGTGTLTDNSVNANVVKDLVDPTYLQRLWAFDGHDVANPMTATPTSRTTGSMAQTITGDGETTSTVTTTS